VGHQSSAGNAATGRWARRLAGVATWIAGACIAVQAQQVYPNGSQQGNAEFGAFPAVTINCRSYVLGPGVRVLDPQQRVVMTAQLDGIGSPVVFQQDALGNVFRVGLVTAAQAAQLNVPQAPSDCGLFTIQ
jgi:hypothetical protein